MKHFHMNIEKNGVSKYFIEHLRRADLHRSSQSTKSAKKLANLVDWPGLCSSALERPNSYAKMLKVKCVGDGKIINFMWSACASMKKS